MKKAKSSKNGSLPLEAEMGDVASPHVAYEGQAYDIMLHALLGKFTGWLSPAAMSLSTIDWLSHIQISPAKQLDLINQAVKAYVNLMVQIYHCLGFFPLNKELICAHPRSNDTRFIAPQWEEFPFNIISNAFLMQEKWWNTATTHIRGVSKHHQQVINFTIRQMLDTFSPSNFSITNPEVIAATISKGGTNFVDGFNNFLEDFYRINYGLPPAGVEKFKVGRDVAITPGKVVYRNRLIELIQYEPTTSKVYAEPILIVPAWIMKYYILDLSPHNSLVKYLVEKGHTVFMISWKNPDSEDRNLGMNDYLDLGIMQSLDVIRKIIPEKKIHAVGYCLGGTLLAIAAAAMLGNEDDRLKSMTLFATQIDFREAGELTLFIDQSQITYLEDIMWEKGYLDGSQMGWAFSMLRSNDLIWSRMVHDYLLGQRQPIIDLIAWDSDTTRLPYRMHSQYLHKLFLNNDLVQGHYKVGKQRVVLSDINIPIFSVGTIKDHVSPWKSVYKIHLYTNTDVTFVLTNGGHNAGIVNEPGHQGRAYQIHTHAKGNKYISSDTWQETVPSIKGSWWPAWQKWLVSLGSEKTNPPPMGIQNNSHPIICDAPGTYVLQK